MKSKFGQWYASLEKKRFIGLVFRGIGMAWRMVANNFGLKVLSLLIAILLWNYVISTNASITRTKTVSGLTGYVTGQSTLSSVYELALLEDPAEKLNDISVTIEVSQADFANVTENNVNVTLDLSNARRAGVLEVPLKATTSYGRIVRIFPSKVQLSLETVDSRVIPVNVQMTGKPAKNHWCKVDRSNPTALTIKGPSSVVQSIASAYVYIDVTNATSSFTAAEPYVLLDSDGNEIPQSMLERSSTSISVTVDVYPTKEIAIDADPESILTGEPAEGYVVESITIQPGVLTVAAEKEFLDSLDTLHIRPISVEGATQSFSAQAKVSALSSIKSISAEEVYVNVSIAEETVGVWMEDVKISYSGKGEGLKLGVQDESVRVYVTGPRSAVESLQKTGFVATVDLSGLTEGEHTVGLSFPVSAHEDVAFTPEKSEVEVSLTR